MKKNYRMQLYIQQDIAIPFTKIAKEKKIGRGTWINELIRQALSEEGFI